jgi:hypothetical protein
MFVCKRCGYETKYKCNLVAHLKKQKLCPCTLENISRDDLLDILSGKDEKTFACDFCGKQFRDRSYKYKHQRLCNGGETIADLKNLVEKLSFQVEEQQKKINTLSVKSVTNNIGTMNVQNNIHVNVRDFARGENTAYLEPQFLLECLRDMDLIKVLEELHFNPDHPENHNVRIRNIKQNLMEYIDNGQWIAKKKDEVLDHLIMNGYRVLHTYYKDNKDEVDDELDEEEKDESLRWLKQIYHEDKDVFKQLKNDAFLLVMNNKALILQKV